MTFDPTKPVQTRDGRKARIICMDAKHVDGEIIALVTYPENHPHEGDEFVASFYKGGHWAPPSYREKYPERADHPDDLVNAPVKTSTWQTIYEHSIAIGVHKTLEDALSLSGTNRVGFLRRDFEDGKFVGVEFEKI